MAVLGANKVDANIKSVNDVTVTGTGAGGSGTKLKAEKHEDAYEVVLAAEPKPGVLPVTATVTAGTETDLLAGEFDLHEEVHAGESAHAHGWQEYAGWAAGAIAALAVLIVVVRRVAANRQSRAGAPA